MKASSERINTGRLPDYSEPERGDSVAHQISPRLMDCGRDGVRFCVNAFSLPVILICKRQDLTPFFPFRLRVEGARDWSEPLPTNLYNPRTASFPKVGHSVIPAGFRQTGWDLPEKSPVLRRNLLLQHGFTWWALKDLNLGPRDYEFYSGDVTGIY